MSDTNNSQHFDDEPLPEPKQQEQPGTTDEAPVPPVGTSASEAAAEASSAAVTGLDADPKTAGRVDEAQAEIDNEEKVGHRGTRVDPTPHHHYTVAGVNAGLPTPETNAAVAFLVGNKGRFADLSASEREEHHSAEGVEDIAKRAAELGYI